MRCKLAERKDKNDKKWDESDQEIGRLHQQDDQQSGGDNMRRLKSQIATCDL